MDFTLIKKINIKEEKVKNYFFFTATQDGILTIGANANLVNAGKETIGSLSNYSGDIPVGKYIKIFVE